MPIPLPTPNPYDTTTQPNLRSAYDRCLGLESRHDQVPKLGRLNVLMCARMLGYLILEAPTEQGRMNFALEVLRHAQKGGDVGLQTLANAYKDHFLRIFQFDIQKNDQIRPASPPSSDVWGELSMDPQGHAELSHALKKRALERDRYCCVITGGQDWTSISKGLISQQLELPVCEAHPARIFDLSPTKALESGDASDYIASAKALLDFYGQTDIIEKFVRGDIYRLEDVLTLSMDAHGWFDSLMVWLNRDPDDPPNTYSPRSIGSNIIVRGMPQIITFATSDAARLPPPDPRYLALHAACARVVDMSGVIDYIFGVPGEVREAGT